MFNLFLELPNHPGAILAKGRSSRLFHMGQGYDDFYEALSAIPGLMQWPYLWIQVGEHKMFNLLIMKDDPYCYIQVATMSFSSEHVKCNL